MVALQSSVPIEFLNGSEPGALPNFIERCFYLNDGKKDIDIQPGFEPGSSEFRFTNELLEGALELEQRIDGICP